MRQRRENVPFDPYHFEKRARAGVTYSALDTFRQIHSRNHWGDAESVSGRGAGAEQTERLRRELPRLLAELEVGILLDVPCGDFSWLRAVELPVSVYIGGDLLPELVDRNRRDYGNAARRFMTVDLTAEPLPPADLLLCRDGLVHLSFADIGRALANIRRSRIRYLLTTTFPDCPENEEIVTGDWRVLNLEQPPFGLRPPLRLLNEGCTEGQGAFRDKSLGLWRVEEI